MKKKIIDENGRLFGKISVIDVIVIIVVVILAAADYVKYGVLDKTSASVQTTPITYTAVASQVSQSNASLLRDGDEIYTDSGIDLGKIINVDSKPSSFASQTVDGTYVMATADGKFDVALTIEAPCSESNGRYYINRTYELSANTEQKMVTKYNSVTATIMSVDTVAVSGNG